MAKQAAISMLKTSLTIATYRPRTTILTYNPVFVGTDPDKIVSSLSKTAS